MKKTGLNGHVYEFSVDYNAIKTDNILDNHKYLMEKKQYKIMLGCISKCFITAITFFWLQWIKCKFFRMCFIE